MLHYIKCCQSADYASHAVVTIWKHRFQMRVLKLKTQTPP